MIDLTSFFKAFRISVYSSAYTMVPTPSLEKSSSSKASSASPSKMWARLTPSLHARKPCSNLDAISPLKSPFFFFNQSVASSTDSWAGFFPFIGKDPLPVRKISFSAFNASATSSATPSELTRYVRPSPSTPIGGITGIIPFSSKVSRNRVSTRSTRPVHC